MTIQEGVVGLGEQMAHQWQLVDMVVTSDSDTSVAQL
jgi:hypothetical protein